MLHFIPAKIYHLILMWKFYYINVTFEAFIFLIKMQLMQHIDSNFLFMDNFCDKPPNFNIICCISLKCK